MKSAFDLKNLKYTPKIFAAVSFIILLVIFAIVFWGRTNGMLRPNFILQLLPDFYQHVSNMSISYVLYAAVGYMWLLLGVHFRYIIMAGIAFLSANIIYELWSPVLNTRDVIDAYYGIAGTFIAFVFLLLTKHLGLTENIKFRKETL